MKPEIPLIGVNTGLQTGVVQYIQDFFFFRD